MRKQKISNQCQNMSFSQGFYNEYFMETPPPPPPPLPPPPPPPSLGTTTIVSATAIITSNEDERMEDHHENISKFIQDTRLKDLESSVIHRQKSGLFFCDACQITINAKGPKNFKQHLEGSIHKFCVQIYKDKSKAAKSISEAIQQGIIINRGIKFYCRPCRHHLEYNRIALLAGHILSEEHQEGIRYRNDAAALQHVAKEIIPLSMLKMDCPIHLSSFKGKWTLHVQGIPKTMTKEEIWDIFEQYGEIKYITIVNNVKSLKSTEKQVKFKGKCYVDFCNEETAAAVKEATHQLEVVPGQKITVNFALTPKTEDISEGGLHYVRFNKYHECGSNIDAASEEHTHIGEPKGKILHVQDLPITMTKLEIWDIFAQYGKIKDLMIEKSRSSNSTEKYVAFRGKCYLDFGNEETAASVKEATDQLEVVPGQKITVNLALKPTTENMKGGTDFGHFSKYQESGSNIDAASEAKDVIFDHLTVMYCGPCHSEMCALNMDIHVTTPKHMSNVANLSGDEAFQLANSALKDMKPDEAIECGILTFRKENDTYFCNSCYKLLPADGNLNSLTMHLKSFNHKHATNMSEDEVKNTIKEEMKKGIIIFKFMANDAKPEYSEEAITPKNIHHQDKKMGPPARVIHLTILKKPDDTAPISNTRLKEVASPYGEVTGVKILRINKRKSTGKFPDRTMCEALLEMVDINAAKYLMDNFAYDKKDFQMVSFKYSTHKILKEKPPTRVLHLSFIKNRDDSAPINDRRLIEIASPYGEVTGVKIMRYNKRKDKNKSSSDTSGALLEMIDISAAKNLMDNYAYDQKHFQKVTFDYSEYEFLKEIRATRVLHLSVLKNVDDSTPINERRLIELASPYGEVTGVKILIFHKGKKSRDTNKYSERTCEALMEMVDIDAAKNLMDKFAYYQKHFEHVTFDYSDHEFLKSGYRPESQKMFDAANNEPFGHRPHRPVSQKNFSEANNEILGHKIHSDHRLTSQMNFPQKKISDKRLLQPDYFNIDRGHSMPPYDRTEYIPSSQTRNNFQEEASKTVIDYGHGTNYPSNEPNLNPQAVPYQSNFEWEESRKRKYLDEEQERTNLMDFAYNENRYSSSGKDVETSYWSKGQKNIPEDELDYDKPQADPYQPNIRTNFELKESRKRKHLDEERERKKNMDLAYNENRYSSSDKDVETSYCSKGQKNIPKDELDYEKPQADPYQPNIRTNFEMDESRKRKHLDEERERKQNMDLAYNENRYSSTDKDVETSYRSKGQKNIPKDKLDYEKPQADPYQPNIRTNFEWEESTKRKHLDEERERKRLMDFAYNENRYSSSGKDVETSYWSKGQKNILEDEPDYEKPQADPYQSNVRTNSEWEESRKRKHFDEEQESKNVKDFGCSSKNVKTNYQSKWQKNILEDEPDDEKPHDKSKYNLYARGWTIDHTKQDVYECFSNYGDINDIHLEWCENPTFVGEQSAYIAFINTDDINALLNEHSVFHIKDSLISIKRYIDSSKLKGSVIHVSGITQINWDTKRELTNYFNEIGPVRLLMLNSTSRNSHYAFVVFDTEEDAKKVISAKETYIFNNDTLKLKKEKILLSEENKDKSEISQRKISLPADKYDQLIKHSVNILKEIMNETEATYEFILNECSSVNQSLMIHGTPEQIYSAIKLIKEKSGMQMNTKCIENKTENDPPKILIITDHVNDVLDPICTWFVDLELDTCVKIFKNVTLPKLYDNVSEILDEMSNVKYVIFVWGIQDLTEKVTTSKGYFHVPKEDLLVMDEFLKQSQAVSNRLLIQFPCLKVLWSTPTPYNFKKYNRIEPTISEDQNRKSVSKKKYDRSEILPPKYWKMIQSNFHKCLIHLRNKMLQSDPHFTIDFLKLFLYSDQSSNVSTGEQMLLKGDLTHEEWFTTKLNAKLNTQGGRALRQCIRKTVQRHILWGSDSEEILLWSHHITAMLDKELQTREKKQRDLKLTPVPNIEEMIAMCDKAGQKTAKK